MTARNPNPKSPSRSPSPRALGSSQGHKIGKAVKYKLALQAKENQIKKGMVTETLFVTRKKLAEAHALFRLMECEIKKAYDAYMNYTNFLAAHWLRGHDDEDAASCASSETAVDDDATVVDETDLGKGDGPDSSYDYWVAIQSHTLYLEWDSALESLKRAVNVVNAYNNQTKYWERLANHPSSIKRMTDKIEECVYLSLLKDPYLAEKTQQLDTFKSRVLEKYNRFLEMIDDRDGLVAQGYAAAVAALNLKTNQPEAQELCPQDEEEVEDELMQLEVEASYMS